MFVPAPKQVEFSVSSGALIIATVIILEKCATTVVREENQAGRSANALSILGNLGTISSWILNSSIYLPRRYIRD